MKASYEAFATLANEYKAAQNTSQEVKEAKTSLSNELGHTALAIALMGSKEDKESLNLNTSKDKPYHSLRGMVSKANQVAFYLLTHDAIDLGESIVTLEAIKGCPEDSVPSVTVNELYKVVNAANKGDVEALNRKKAIEKQAIEQASTFLNNAVTKKQFALLPADKQAAFIEEATAIVDAQEAAKSKAKAVETRAEAVARIVAEINALGAWDEVALAFTGEASQAA